MQRACASQAADGRELPAVAGAVSARAATAARSTERTARFYQTTLAGARFERPPEGQGKRPLPITAVCTRVLPTPQAAYVSYTCRGRFAPRKHANCARSGGEPRAGGSA